VPLREGQGAICLSPDELEVASRFHFHVDRQRYEASHSALRHIMSGYTSLEPRAIRFIAGPWGKPELAHDKRMQFNLSHSGLLAMVAISLIEPVGIDVEDLRREVDHLAIASAAFSQAENRDLLSCSPSQRIELFFRTWVKKEAYLKARGVGLSSDPSKLEISVPDNGGFVVAPHGERDSWWVSDVDVGRAHVAAFATRGTKPALRLFEWNG
jgi:4'-phosphopantetheinyl transferase